MTTNSTLHHGVSQWLARRQQSLACWLVLALIAVMAAGASGAAPGRAAEPAPQDKAVEVAKPQAKPAPAASDDGMALAAGTVARLWERISAVKAQKAEAAEVLSVFANPFADMMRDLFVQSRRIREAQSRLDAALEKRFGPDASNTMRLPNFGAYEANFRAGLEDINALALEGPPESRGAGGYHLTVKAELKPAKDGGAPRTRKDRYVVVRGSDGVWRLLPELAADSGVQRLMAVQVAAFAKAPEVLDRVATDTAAGKYKTRQEAHQAAFAAFLSVVQNLEQKLPAAEP